MTSEKVKRFCLFACAGGQTSKNPNSDLALFTSEPLQICFGSFCSFSSS
jgi:hypothetical protein